MDDSKDDPKDDSKDDQNGPKDDQDDPDNSDASGNDQEDQKPDQDETPDENTDSADSSDNSGKDDNGNSGNKDSLSDKNISPNPEKNGKNKEMSLLTVDYEDVTYTFDLDPDDHTATLKDISNPAEASEIEIPEQVTYDEDEAEDNEYTVTILRWGPFAGSRQNVSALMIPDTVEKCDVYFSRFSNLTEITIPGSVKKFGGNFQNMDKLETITVEEGVQEISGNSMVSNCSSLETIDLPESLKYITGPAAFASAEKLKNISLPDGVEIKKASGLFSDDISLTSITLPDSVASIPQSAFSGCSALEEVTAKGQITEIGQQAFYKDTALAKIPDSVTSIADHAFEYTSIEHLILGSGLESIKNDAFSNIGTLETVTIRNSSDAVDISKAGFSGNAVITYTEKSISDSVGSAISDEAGAPTL